MFIIIYIYFFFLIVPLKKYCGKISYSVAAHRWQYGACALRAGYLNLQIHTHTKDV